MRSWVPALICLTVPFFLCSGARSEDTPDLAATVATYAAGGERILKTKIIPELTNAFTPDQRELLSKIEWRFPSSPNALDARAFVDEDSGAKVIEISGGHLYLLDSLVNASVLANEFNKEDVVADYFFEIVRNISKNAEAHTQGKPEIPMQTFAQYASIPIEAANNYQHSKDYQFKRGLSFTDGLAVVASHEFAHHLLGHTLSGPISMSESRRREAAADEFATKTAAKAGFSPISIIPFMGLLASTEAGAVPSSDADHPPSICRQVEFTISAAPSILNDPTLERFLSANPAMRPTLNVFAASVTSMNRFDALCCNENERGRPECWPTINSSGPDYGYCIPLATALRAASKNFDSIRGNSSQTTGNAEVAESALKLLHFNGCRISVANRRASFICEDGYLDSESRWQSEFANHSAAITGCDTFIDTTWNIDKDESDANGEYAIHFWPEDDSLGRVSLQKIRDSQGQLFVRITVRPQ